MKVFLDNALIRKIKLDGMQNFLEICRENGISPEQITFGWSSLFEYMDLGSIFETFPKFDKQNSLFAYIKSILPLDAAKTDLFHLYDQTFVECLTLVKALPEINPTFLIRKIEKKRREREDLDKIFSFTIDNYENRLSIDPANAMHDLTLYLAWDRVCVDLAILFEYISPDGKLLKGLNVFRECLIESFQHITAQERTSPSFFRLINALFIYGMRDENLQKHTESEWQVFCQSFPALKSEKELMDVYYIDSAIVSEKDLEKSATDPITIMTMDSVEKVNTTLALAQTLIKKLKKEEPVWSYTLRPTKIICLNHSQEGFSVVETLTYS